MSAAVFLQGSFCDLNLHAEGVDCFFNPNFSEAEQVKAAVCKVKQVHGKEILPVGYDLVAQLSGPRYTQFEFDGMMTDEPGPVLAVYTADCMPVLFFEPKRRVIASIHAGWRGTLLDICGTAIDLMVQKYQCDPSRIRVVSGPSIQICCFEIRDDVASLFRQADPGFRELSAGSDGKMKLDLQAINRRQLLKRGVLANHIELSKACTFCGPELFPSYRREGSSARRIVSGIRLRDGHKIQS